MPLLDITDPKIIRFLTESYEKESRLRMHWVQLNFKNIEKCATFKSDVKNYTQDDITKATLITGMATMKQDHIRSKCHKLKAPVPESAKTTYNKSPQLVMMPVKDEVKYSLLESRKEYLKIRGKEPPEAKYYFIESNNWKYGWKFNESKMRMSGPVYARVCHTVHNLQSRVGPQPDPLHYGSPYIQSHPCFN